MRFQDDESGQVLVLSAMCMMLILAFLALAVDTGLLFRAKRNLQVAADAAATAAALDYYYNSSSGSAAINEADAIGVAAASLNNVNASNGTTVDVHCPVTSGAFANSNCDGYFEAIISQPNPTFFMRIFNRNSVTVGARAVAGTPYAADACIYVLGANGNIGPGGGGNGIGRGDSSMYLFGSFNITAPNCAVVVNGTASGDALRMQGNGGSLNASSIAVVGGVSGSGATPTPVTGAAPVEDPLKARPQPTPSGPCTSGGSISDTSFGDGACFSGDSHGNLTLTNDTFNGTFIFTGTGTLTFGGNVTSGVDGATIYLQNGSMAENSGTIFTGPTGSFAAPTSGSLQGIAFMAPKTNTNTMELEFGNSSGTIAGIFYMPAATLYMHDSGGNLVLDMDLVVGQIDDQTASVTINGYGSLNPTLSPIKAVALVE